MKKDQARAGILAFLAYNATIGMIGASFGTLLPGLALQYQASHALTASTASLWMVMLGITAPVVGLLLQRMSIRHMMVAGALVNALAFALMGIAQSMEQIVLLFGLAGVGTGMLGVLCPTALISRWFDEGRGRVLGLVTLPVTMLLTPLALSRILENCGGVPVASLAMASVFGLLVPCMMLVVDHPRHVRDDVTAVELASKLSVSQLLHDPRFLAITFGVGILAGSGAAFVVHTISYLMEKGMDLETAASTYTAYALAGFGGTLLFGWLADKIGAATSLLICAALFALGVQLMTLTGSPLALLVICGLIGLSLIALNALHGAVLAEMYGPRNVASVMGFSCLLTVPCLLVLAPAAGHIFDVTKNYFGAYVMLALSGACSAILFAVARGAGRNSVPRVSDLV